ncbi:alginate lyase family protein [Izhakiella australiensis]|nr:alginate lyase family protein [Izhakiella australiensis]
MKSDFRCMLILAAGMFLTATVRAAEPDLAYFSRQDLQQNRQALIHHQASALTRQAWLALKRQADKALKKPNPSVMDKQMVPPSGTKHDYLSLSAYWWPDDKSANGLPWIRKDGQVNPASKNAQSDGVRFAAFTADVQALTLAWYFSGEARYAAKAEAMLRHWFIDPDSRMNPHLNYAQGVPGIASGRHVGVLDGRYLATRIVDALILLRAAPGWHAQDAAAMHKWFSDYLRWLVQSPLAQGERNASNNHGSWYANQVAGIAWYLGQPQLVAKMVTLAQEKIDHQIAADGRQPQELARTRSFHYSYFNLQALTGLAQLATRSNTGDLWHYQNPAGGSLLKALDYMAPFSDDARPWPWKNRDRIGVRLIALLVQADNSLDRPRYRQWIEKANWQIPPQQADKYASGIARGAVLQAQRDSGLLTRPPEQKETE